MINTGGIPLSRFLKLLMRIACLSVLLITAVWASGTSQVQASSRFTCVLTNGYGQVTILSCGSSAGNFIYTCSTTDPGPCDISPPINDEIANMSCTQYEKEGYPETLFGDGDEGGGIGGLMP